MPFNQTNELYILICLSLFIIGLIINIGRKLLKKKETKRETITYIDKNGKKKTFYQDKLYKQNEKIRKNYYKNHDVSKSKLKPINTKIYHKNKIDPEIISKKPLNFEKAYEFKYKR